MKTSLSLILSYFLLVACGGSDSSNVTELNGYNGPGSQYNLSLNNNNTFTLSESDDGWSASGSYSTLDSGYTKLTVSSVSGGTSGPSSGDTAYLLDIPGVVALLKPFGTDTQVISMVRSGSCPTADFSANWINTNKNIDITDSTRDVYGTFAYTNSSSSATIPATYAFDDTSLGSNSLGSLTCSNGIAEVGDARMYLTQVGGAIVHTGVTTPSDETDDSFIVATSTQTLSSSSALDGNYIGLVFEGSSGSDSVDPVFVTLSGGSGTGQKYTDVDANTLDSSSVAISISSVNDPSAGFMKGTVGGAPIRCITNTDLNGSGKNLIFCDGENPGEANQLYNLLLVSQ